MTIESTVVNQMRGVMNLLHPLTGATRAQLTLTLTASPGVTFLLKPNAWVFPVLGGGATGPATRRPDLLFKTGRNPLREDGFWQITDAGNTVPIIANLGGVRHNVPNGVTFNFDFPSDDIVTMVVTSIDVLATDPVGPGNIQSMAIYEEASSDFFLDLRRASVVTKFPAVIVSFENMFPADGSTVNTLSRREQIARDASLYRIDIQLTLFSSRDEGDSRRRLEGMSIVDGMMRLLTNRSGTDDGDCVSNPGGVQVLQMFRDNDNQQDFQKFYIYTLRIATTVTLQTIDSRTFNPWLTAIMDVEKPQDPNQVNQGSLTMAQGIEIQMANDTPALILEDTAAALTGWWEVPDRKDGLSPAIENVTPQIVGGSVLEQLTPAQQPTLTKLKQIEFARFVAANTQHFNAQGGFDMWAAAATEISVWLTARCTTFTGSAQYLMSVSDVAQTTEVFSLKVDTNQIILTAELSGGPVTVTIDYQDPNEHLFLCRLTAGELQLIIDGVTVGTATAATAIADAGEVLNIGTDIALTATLDGVFHGAVTAEGLVPESQDSRMTTYLMTAAGL
jgi:hypothetical protein